MPAPDITTLLVSTIASFLAKYPDAPPDARPYIIGEAVAHVMFTVQPPPNKGLFRALFGGVAKAKENLTIETIPFSYMNEQQLPVTLATYLAFRASDATAHAELAQSIKIAIASMPPQTNRSALISDARRRRIRWAVLV
jgi:hypothetical protein